MISLARALFAPRAVNPFDDRYFNTEPVFMSAAGIPVSTDAAYRQSVVFRCISLLSNKKAEMPFGMVERLPRGRRVLEDHPVTRIMTLRPNPFQSAFEFRRLMMGHLVFRGNAYARIWRGASGLELWPLHPDRIKGPELIEGGRLRYRYTRPDTNQDEVLLGDEDLLHISGLSSDGFRGLALTDLARESIGLALATEQHGARLFSQGVRLSGVLKTPGKMAPEAKNALGAAFERMYSGLYGAHRVPILEQGLEFQAIGMTAEDSQFIESRRFEVAEIARWFGVPPHMVGDVERSTSWGTGIEAQATQFLQYSLMPWLVLWEQALQRALVPEPNYRAKFFPNAMLRSDTKTRFEVYQTAIASGIMSPNECRELEDMNPREGGDEYVTPTAPQQAAAAAPPKPAPPPRKGREEDDDRADALARAAVAAVLTDETEALKRLASEHRPGSASWRAAVASHYGRVWPDVVRATMCPEDAAKAWARARRDEVLSGVVDRSGASLLALATGRGEGTC